MIGPKKRSLFAGVFSTLLFLSSVGFCQGDRFIKRVKLNAEEILRSKLSAADFKAVGSLEHLDAYEIEYENQGHVIRGIQLEPKAAGTYPVIYFNRGGNRDFAELNLQTLVRYTSSLVSEGYVILASNYREEDEFGGREVTDVTRLMDLTYLLEKADTSKKGMLGWSRGGMMAYLVMARRSDLKTVVVGNAPSDLARVLEERPKLEESVLSQCIPNYWQSKSEELQKRSAVHWPQKLNSGTSLLILAGKRDRHVNYDQSIKMAKALENTKVEFELKTFETDHFFSNLIPPQITSRI